MNFFTLAGGFYHPSAFTFCAAAQTIQKQPVDLLERLGQEEALLHVVVGRVGGVDVLHS